MMLEQEYIEKVRISFSKMKTKQDLLDLLNFVKPKIYGANSVDFKLSQLTWHANAKLGGVRYFSFSVKKKSGADRVIHAPVKGLKALQKTLSLILQCVYIPNKSATGFVNGRSIVDNAKIHVFSNYVYNIDLKDFFPSVDQARVWKTIQLKPFSLYDRKEIASIIASIVCTEMEVERVDENGCWQKVKRNVLPQGAPTSPVITNIVCQKLDYLLLAVANRFGLKYTRYADDITFSSMHNVYQPGSDFLNELHRIISEQNFHIKESKTRLQKSGYRQEVTGLLVNDEVNVKKRYVKQLRMWLYLWERYGYERASNYFVQHYFLDKGHVNDGKPEMRNVISGKLDYLSMVKGKGNTQYCLLRERFEKLTRSSEIDKILGIWENIGLETAIIYFNSKRK